MKSSTRSSSPTCSDEDLARDAQAGSKSSFEELVRRHQVSLLRFLRERVRSENDAEDLLQETFVRAYQRLDRYRDAWRFSTWLFTIGHRLAISHLRSRRPVNVAHPDELAFTPDRRVPTDPGARMADAESRQRFWDVAAAVLSDEQMAAVWLYYVEGLAAPEVATVLDRSWVSVKTMLFRARRKLEPSFRSMLEAGNLPVQLERWVKSAPAVVG